jgi:serine/threonine protein kinase
VDPERWCNIEKLYESVVERSPAERARLLAEADPDVRAEVEVLLAQPSGGALLDEHAADLLGESTITQLAAGAQLRHYQIVAMLGRGGMGVVYRARDTKLGREVAIKVLPDSLAQDPDRLARFNREAKLLASLNHPNIAQIYGVESQALVMELVEGPNLKGPLPIETALNYAKQITEALEAAHEKGIIHRDLKPANIMVTPTGVVKVLDFGLAKAEAPLAAGDPADSTGTTLSPTRAGIILGTAAYMSPEQARGETVDKRTDIWSFGAVLYEMLTGKRAFPGNSITDILAGVLRGEPDWSALPPATALGIRKLLHRCLERDRKQRLQAIGEARIAIEASHHARPWSRGATVLLASITVVAALLALAWPLLRRTPKPTAEPTQKRLTFNSSDNPVRSEAISPDGQYLAYSDSAGIHLRLLSSGDERLVPRPLAVPTNTYWQVDSWFPDGTRLLADASEPGGVTSMWTISVVGQNPRHLRDGGSGFNVSPDGTRIAYGQSGKTGDIRELWVMSAEGDNSQKILTVEADQWLVGGQWSLDGQRLAYIRFQPSANPDVPRSSIETWDLRQKRRTMVGTTALPVQGFCWLPDGQIVFATSDTPTSRDGSLWRIDLDNNARTPNNTPKRITTWAEGAPTALSVSRDGKQLVLLRQTDQSPLYVGELDAGGTRLKSVRRLRNEDADEFGSAWTKDSRAILFTSNRSGTQGIYRQEVDQETAEPVFTSEWADLARLSADGAWVLFRMRSASSGLSSVYRLMRVPVSGGAPQFVMETHGWNYICANNGEGTCVVLEEAQDHKQVLITAFDPLNGRNRVLRIINKQDPLESRQSALSPDGSTCALSKTSESKIQIRLLALAGGSDNEMTVKGWSNMTNLDWSSDGKGFYCGSSSANGSTLLYVDLKGDARVLWKTKGDRVWGIPSPDGRRLAIGARVTSSNVWMIEGF